MSDGSGTEWLLRLSVCFGKIVPAHIPPNLIPPLFLNILFVVLIFLSFFFFLSIAIGFVTFLSKDMFFLRKEYATK